MAPYYGQDKLSPERMQTEPEMETRMLPCMVYPEVFYRLQPYIMMVCDNAEANGITMPTQEMIETITDNIYEDIVRSNPDIGNMSALRSTGERHV